MNRCYILRRLVHNLTAQSFITNIFKRTVSDEVCQPLICAVQFLIGTSLLDWAGWLCMSFSLTQHFLMPKEFFYCLYRAFSQCLATNQPMHYLDRFFYSNALLLHVSMCIHHFQGALIAC
jgi:hypothetical protein